MLLTSDEAQALLEPYQGRLTQWHEDGYKDRRHAMTTLPDQWAAQDAGVWGWWTRNLILARADADESEFCYRHKDGVAEVVRIHDDTGRLAAQLRLRRVEMQTPWEGSGPAPHISTPSTETAEDWFGNRHLRDPRQVSFFDSDPHERSHTNLLIGRTEDRIGDFERLFVVCYAGAHPAWHYEITDGAAEVHALLTSTPSLPFVPEPKRPPLEIRSKEHTP
jgi:hypothetical protein